MFFFLREKNIFRDQKIRVLTGLSIYFFGTNKKHFWKIFIFRVAKNKSTNSIFLLPKFLFVKSQHSTNLIQMECYNRTYNYTQ